MSDELPAWAQRGRLGWKHTGSQRPPFALAPGPGQESVWDYPRPPRLERDTRRVVVRCGEVIIADTRAALRLLETAHPPTFYLPPADIDDAYLRASTPSRGSRCEWKGSASYWDVVADGQHLQRVAWSYPTPFDYRELAGHLAFYASAIACFVDGERARPQPGGFYGGWVTDELVGPFKGEPNTSGW